MGVIKGTLIYYWWVYKLVDANFLEYDVITCFITCVDSHVSL